MIISHEHKFIFLKTKKTAGTAIEAALSELCGPDCVITPYREESEGDRKGRPPQNYRIEHPLKPKRPLWRRLLGRPERYYHPSVGFYEHMPASLVHAYVGDEVWRSYFKFAFDRNPWDRQISWYFYKTKSKASPPSFESFMASRRRAYVDNHEIYMEGGALAVDFLGRYESLDADLARALRYGRASRGGSRCRSPTSRPTRQSGRIIGAITPRIPRRWCAIGTRRRSRCSITAFDGPYGRPSCGPWSRILIIIIIIIMPKRSRSRSEASSSG